MPIIGWVIYILISIVITIICILIAIEINMVRVLSIVTFCLCLILFLAMHWYFNNTATGRRAYKSQESNFSNGIERVVRVYDVNGKFIGLVSIEDILEELVGDIFDESDEEGGQK